MATPDPQKYSKSTRKVLAFVALNNGVELRGSEISTALKMMLPRISPVLHQLENEGLVQSKWKEGPKPRHRLYWCTDPQGVIDCMEQFFPNELKNIPRLK